MINPSFFSFVGVVYLVSYQPQLEQGKAPTTWPTACLLMSVTGVTASAMTGIVKAWHAGCTTSFGPTDGRDAQLSM